MSVQLRLPIQVRIEDIAVIEACNRTIYRAQWLSGGKGQLGGHIIVVMEFVGHCPIHRPYTWLSLYVGLQLLNFCDYLIIKLSFPFEFPFFSFGW